MATVGMSGRRWPVGGWRLVGMGPVKVLLRTLTGRQGVKGLLLLYHNFTKKLHGGRKC